VRQEISVKNPFPFAEIFSAYPDTLPSKQAGILEFGRVLLEATILLDPWESGNLSPCEAYPGCQNQVLAGHGNVLTIPPCQLNFPGLGVLIVPRLGSFGAVKYPNVKL
jgi:hypothetical protein